MIRASASKLLLNQYAAEKLQACLELHSAGRVRKADTF
jgi:hypothetical protein